MHCLILKPGTATAQAFPLRTGVNRLGRKPGNHIQIAHESVSGLHCEIVVEEDQIRLRDLGSTNGTRVNGVVIEETLLRVGDRVTFGTVGLVLQEHDASEAAVTPAQTEPPPQVADPVGQTEPAFVGEKYCRNHPHGLATYFCGKCRYYFCELCVPPRQSGGMFLHFCRACGSAVTPVRSGVERSKPVGFFPLVGGAFAYPFRGSGPILLLGGAVFLALVVFAMGRAIYAFRLGTIALMFLTLFGGGYVFAYIKSIALTSAQGDDEMPDWPDFTEMGSDIVVPFTQGIALSSFCFAPAIAALVYAVRSQEPLALYIAIALGVVALLYFPMALLGVSLHDGIIGMSPALVVPSIIKVAGHYAVALGIFFVVAAVGALTELLLGLIFDLPIISALLGWLITFYALVVQVRIMGVLYRANEPRLSWFRKPLRPG